MSIDKEIFSKQLGINIAKYRQALGLTQEQLAEKLDLGNEAISRIERGVAIPSLMRLFEFSKVFHCNVADLLSEGTTKKDDIEYIALLLKDLSENDRQFTIRMLEQLVVHLRTKP
ncbi:hypothetical protein A4G16_09760 [Mannheimia granulomatis]|uniref:HTH cro/C1-type domain-containing protein n=2 Tax=Mannheimia granulomatis TaxID=85402 RepID=A0A6G8JKA7_9PAST|nr:hypothetical protein A4G16_09760 [Mannheimia granulomatis]